MLKNISVAKVVEVHGPGVNVMSCSKPVAFNLPFAKVACYGIWDSGNEFGGDPDMCRTGGGSGCLVKTLACESWSAITLKRTSPENMSINSSELMLYASTLGLSQEAVKQNIITLWEYTCN
jgi:hypothetical protein